MQNSRPTSAGGVTSTVNRALMETVTSAMVRQGRFPIGRVMPARGKSLRLRGGGCCASKLEEDKEEQGEGLRQTNDPPSDTLAAVEKATAEMKKKEIAEAKEAQRSASPKSPLKPKGSS
eukprot:3907128-Prymnesium_polylepis.2